MDKSLWVKLALTIMVMVGGSAIALNKETPIEVREAVISIVGIAAGWWFKSPLDD